MAGNEYAVSETRPEAGPSTRPQSTSGNREKIVKCLDSFQLFIYNPETKKIMGRNLPGWGKLGLFYLIFYSALFGFVAVFFQIFLLTTNQDRPTYNYHDEGLQHPILANPGMSMRPLITTKTRVVELKFDRREISSFRKYVNSIDGYLQDVYSPGVHTVAHCSGTESTTCNLNLNDLGECDGVSDPNFGYDSGEPCVLLKLNKIIGWKPNLQENETHIPITCIQTNTRQCSNCLGNPEIYPSDGLPKSCFPYCGKESSSGYSAPVVMVKFKDIARNKKVSIYCKASSDTFHHNKATQIDKLMSIVFSVEVQE